jgi:hypothetical protein
MLTRSMGFHNVIDSAGGLPGSQGQGNGQVLVMVALLILHVN